VILRHLADRPVLLALGLFAALVLPWMIYPPVAMDIAAWALFAAAVDLLLGFTGLLSFGHAAFWGTSAYVSGLIALHTGLPFPVAILGGALAAAVLAIPIGYLSVRLNGIYFAMVTLAFAQMVYFVVNQWREVTGGENGLQGIPRELFGADLSDPFVYYYAALPFVLAGLSMGGYVALAYAKKYPTDLRGLVLIDTKAEADTAEGKQGRAKMIDLVRKDGSKAVADQMMPKMLAKDAAEQRPQTAQTLRRMMEACPPKTIEHALAAMRDRPDRSGELSQIKVPTLVIVGESDAITPPAAAEAMVNKVPGAQLVVIKGAGHMSPMEQPEQVNRALRAFLDGIKTG
jgi:esterase/lipase